MRIGRAVAGMGVAALAVAAGLAGNAGAGFGTVPAEGLGKSNGLRYMVGSVEIDATSDVVVLTPCPDSTQVVGGGVDFTGPRTASQLSSTRPDEQSWFGQGQALTTTEKVFRVFAICRLAGVEGIAHEGGSINLMPDAVGSVQAACPSGTRPIAGGPEMDEGTVTRSTPFDDSDPNKSPDGWRVTGRRGDGSAQLDLYVVCLDATRKQVAYVKESERVKPGRARSVKAACPRSKSVTGGGFKIGGGPESYVHSTKPVDGRIDKNDVPDDRWESTLVNGGDTRTRGTSTAVCLG